MKFSEKSGKIGRIWAKNERRKTQKMDQKWSLELESFG